MNDNGGLALIAPKVTPLLDPFFRPAVLANRAFRELVRDCGQAVPVAIALEQADGSIFHFHTDVLPEGHAQVVGNAVYLERMVKSLLWLWGGFRIHFNGSKSLGESLERHYRQTPAGKFDSEIIGQRIYDH